MDAEMLELLKELQPLFRECMGAWEVGDILFHIDSDDYEETGIVVENKCEAGFILVRWDWDAHSHVALKSIEKSPHLYLRVPDAISRDPERPERGLLGMSNHYVATFTQYGATVTQYYSADGTVPFRMETFSNPYLAILKALAWQVKEEKK